MSRYGALAFACTLLLPGCSSFNMVADCDQTGLTLMRTMVVPDGERPDDARLAELMSVSTPREVAAGYNERRCSADLTALGATQAITYTIRQSEGVKGWVEVDLPTDAQTMALREALRSAYVG
ncbi:hypothetical protein HJG53_02610 [Sphingomonas sp. ID1715]|uniref:hypothetical protein n=1 Tax=Sphingomonas sp. ID1715 TaxID=1656898 RepID=UPI0014878AC5|nr:hypothetical protein [Sphingomonas sp. ID1715]NNM75798.1 hypothetical protein [Sphingomonas sp. ID1715]